MGTMRGQVAAHQRETVHSQCPEGPPGACLDGGRQSPARPRRSHPPQRDMRGVGPRFTLETEARERAVHAPSQDGEQTVTFTDAGPEDAWAGGCGEGAEPADREVEGPGVARDARQRLLDICQPPGLDAAEELQRQVEVVDRDPADVPGGRPESFDLGAE